MRRDAPELFELTQEPALPAEPAVIRAAIEPLLSEERKQRMRQVIALRSRAVVPVLDRLIDPHNVAAVLRSAEAFGVHEVHLIQGEEPFLASRRIAQGTERWVDVQRHASAEACVRALRSRGYRIYVATMDGELGPDALANEPRAAVVFGNEHEGVSPELRRLADASYTIPMRGFVQSFNVSVAAALTLYAATRGRGGDLSPDEQELLHARYCMLSMPRADEVLAEHVRRGADERA
jgi:tRNA (guanosine-2'-O-)-methyltransferase